MAIENWKKAFKFSNLFQILNQFEFKSNFNFDDFYLHNKIQEHFTTHRKICIGIKCNKHNYLFTLRIF
jgi:hypothetical protein